MADLNTVAEKKVAHGFRLRIGNTIRAFDRPTPIKCPKWEVFFSLYGD